MMKIDARISKGNNRGVGFIRIPISQRDNFEIDNNYRICIFDNDKSLAFYGKIKDYSGLGVYVPKEIVKSIVTHNELQVFFEEIDGFYASISKGGRLYVPKSISEEICLEQDEIVLISANIENKIIEKFCRIRKHVNKKGIADFFCFVGPELSYKKGIFKIKEKIGRPQDSSLVSGAIKSMNLGLYGGNIIIFDGHKTSIKINLDVNLSDIAYYLGHFFADGTKRGNSWGLAISTFEQANVFIDIHKKLISDSNLDVYLSFSGSEKVRDSLSNTWYKKTGINTEKIRFYKKDISKPENRNEFGTLVLREHRKLTQIYYNHLIDLIFERVEKDNDKMLAIDFICGVLEGDGSPSSKSHGHIVISTNKEDASKLERILIRTSLQFKVCEENNPEKFYIRIGALGILGNLPILKDKLFRYYPKRRKKFIERFSEIGASRFILGKQKKASAWVKAYLRDNNILDDNYQLTKYGKEVRKCLKEMSEEISCRP